MTHLEALEAVEEALTKLHLKDHFGTYLIGIEAIGAIHKFAPDKLKQLEDLFGSKKIDPETYYLEMVKLIREFKLDRIERTKKRTLEEASRTDSPTLDTNWYEGRTTDET